MFRPSSHLAAPLLNTRGVGRFLGVSLALAPLGPRFAFPLVIPLPLRRCVTWGAMSPTAPRIFATWNSVATFRRTYFAPI